MSARCPHGFPPADCLICQTLGTQPQAQVQDRGQVSGAGAAGRPSKAQRRAQVPDRPASVYPPGTPPERPRSSSSSHLAVAVVGVIALAVLAWFLAGAVFAVLRVLELLVVAGLAGWVGYRFGVYRGRHRGP